MRENRLDTQKYSIYNNDRQGKHGSSVALMTIRINTVHQIARKSTACKLQSTLCVASLGGSRILSSFDAELQRCFEYTVCEYEIEYEYTTFEHEYEYEYIL